MTQPVNTTWSAKQGKFRKPSAIVANLPKKETEGVYKYRLKHWGQISDKLYSLSLTHPFRKDFPSHSQIDFQRPCEKQTDHSSHGLFNFIKNWIIGRCNSRIVIGSLYHTQRALAD